MPRIGGTGNPSFRGNLMVDTVRGRVRVRSWPRKRGRNLHPNVVKQNDWFREANRLAKLADPGQYATAVERAKGTGLYPRDLLVRAQAGGFFDILEADGQLVTPRPKRFPTVSFQGCLLRQSSAQSLPGATTTILSWDYAELDAGGWWSVADPERITVPEGINVIAITVGIYMSTGFTGGGFVEVRPGSGTFRARSDVYQQGARGHAFSTGPIPVSEGDYFYAQARPASNTQTGGGGLTHLGVTVLDNQ